MSNHRSNSVSAVGLSHIANIREWQLANGDFRRLPPRGFDLKLSNWVGFCRTQYRRGALDTTTSNALAELGIQLESATDGIQPPPSFYDKAQLSIAQLDALKAESDVSEAAAWRRDAALSSWLTEMCGVAAKRPNLVVWKDMERMVPNVYSQTIGKSIGSRKLAPSGMRGTDNLLEAIVNFHQKHLRLPSLICESADERQLASWLVRYENGLVDAHAFSRKREQVQECLLDEVASCLHGDSKLQRGAQWHWWSMCALSTLQDPEVGNRWHNRLYTKTLSAWIKTLGRDPRKQWEAQTLADMAQDKVAHVIFVRLALEGAKDSSARAYSMERQAPGAAKRSGG